MVSLLAIAALNFFVFAGVADGIIIEVDGQLYAGYKFSEINSGKTVEIRTDFGYNLVEIEPSRVRVPEASCPDQSDVKQGWISKPNQSIICLPNRLVVRLTGKSDTIDKVTY